MCFGDGGTFGSLAGTAGSEYVETTCEDLDAKLQVMIKSVIIGWSISKDVLRPFWMIEAGDVTVWIYLNICVKTIRIQNLHWL